MAAAAAVAGAAVGIYGSLKSGQDEYNALSLQAKLQRQNATEALQKGQVDADRQQLIAGHRIGSEEAAFSASGVGMDSGSVMAVLGASHAASELDRMNILHGATIRAINYENQAGFDERGAASAREGSYWRALSFGLGGASKVYGQGASGGQVPIDDGLEGNANNPNYSSPSGSSDKLSMLDSTNSRRTPLSDGQGGFYNDLLDGTGDMWIDNQNQKNYRVPKGSV